MCSISLIHLPDDATILFDLFVYPHLKKHPCTNPSSTHSTIDGQCRRPGPPRQKITVRDLSDFLWEAFLNNRLARFSSHRATYSLPVHIFQDIFRIFTGHSETRGPELRCRRAIEAAATASWMLDGWRMGTAGAGEAEAGKPFVGLWPSKCKRESPPPWWACGLVSARGPYGIRP